MNAMPTKAGNHDRESVASDSAGMGDQRLLSIDLERFRLDFNRKHFEVTHQLTGHPLFQIPRLLELAREMSAKWPKDIYYDHGVTNIGERWRTQPAELSVEETLERLETSKGWIDFKSAERSREYGKVLNTCIRDLLRVSGRQLESSMRRKQMAIFITSPNRLSTYHMDSEVNFLLQLRGEKKISIFPKGDAEVVLETEKERFWTVDPNAAIYKPQLRNRADVVDLRPGIGVHIPVNAPHWVQNGNNISVSVAILYHSWPHAYANLYAANHLLRRRLGMTPTPPFKSRFIDTLKQPLGAAALHLWALRHGAARDSSGNAAGILDRTPLD